MQESESLRGRVLPQKKLPATAKDFSVVFPYSLRISAMTYL